MRLLVVIPALNEERTIADVVQRVLDTDLSFLGIQKDVVVVDDGSTDTTAGIVASRFPSVRLIRNERRQGKGGAIMRAIGNTDAEYVIIQDADLEYDPVDYPRLLEPIVRGKAQVVYGSRFLSKRYPTKMLFLNYVGNLIGTWLANALYGYSLTDLMTGYKIVPLNVLKRISSNACGFDICPEITARLAHDKIGIYEVPISYTGRTRKEGKKIALLDSLCIMRSLIRNKLRG